MNILHFKYAVTVAKTQSISKAAEVLNIGQPNLSRAIKDLEKTLGITIFNRTAKGIVTTAEGDEFLQYAREITSMINEVEQIYLKGKCHSQHLSVCVPRASYISCSFANFAKNITRSETMDISYQERSSMETIDKVLHGECGIGIIRYQENLDKYYNEVFKERNLIAEDIAEFQHLILTSKHSPIAKLDEVHLTDLLDLVEIAHSDTVTHSSEYIESTMAEDPLRSKRRIYVFERGIQFELLESNHDSFMWVSPAPDFILERHDLIQKPCVDNQYTYKDVLIYRKGYHPSQLDYSFVEAITNGSQEFFPEINEEPELVSSYFNTHA